METLNETLTVGATNFNLKSEGEVFGKEFFIMTVVRKGRNVKVEYGTKAECIKTAYKSFSKLK